MGKLGDQLRREQEQEAAAEADKITSGGRADGGGRFSDGIHRRDRDRAQQQLGDFRDRLRRFPGIGNDEQVFHMFRDYPLVTDHWAVVKAERAARHPRENSDTQEAESVGGDPRLVRQPTRI